jgi:hypothetical protein
VLNEFKGLAVSFDVALYIVAGAKFEPENTAIPGQHLSALISTAYIFDFRKENTILFNNLGQNHPGLCISKKIISLILLLDDQVFCS